MTEDTRHELQHLRYVSAGAPVKSWEKKLGLKMVSHGIRTLVCWVKALDTSLHPITAEAMYLVILDHLKF